jgi:signal transduction histidine kinase/DNA-binding response OmpR family regulator
MQSNGLHKLNLWLEKQLFFQGCTNKQLKGNKTVLENHIFLATYAFTLTISLSILAPQLTIYIQYGILFVILYFLSVSLQLLFPRRHLVIHTCISTTMHLLTFYFMVKLGGIPTSGGLIFSGISNVLATIPRQRTWFPVAMFLLYCVLVILLVILKPWLHVPDQMTPFLNSTLFMLQSIFLTGAALVFVLQFIRQQRKFEELEARHLKEINEFKDKFFTNITHEFRTPLTIIEGMADLIGSQPEKWMGTGLQKIKTNSGILLRLVNQMLNLAKIETGAISMNFVRRDVNKYLAFLVDQFQSEAIRRKIDLRFASMSDTFEMDFDPDKLMHILTNLVSNALKYTNEGGQVEVITNPSDNGSMFSIMVRDTGIGIEKEHLSHLFERFYRIEHQISPGGTGIGLAVTREMVQLLHGTISVESIIGKGSEFSVLLPVTRNAELSDTPEFAELISVTDDLYNNKSSSAKTLYPQQSHEVLSFVDSSGPVERPLLLMVEDNSDVVLYLQAILKNKYRIEVAENGYTGMKKAMDIIPDIILSDVMMPVMDGIELLEKVKNDIRTSHIPVVMLSAKADIDSRLEGLERGADAYLAKPFIEKELLMQLKNLVYQRKKLHDRYVRLEKIPDTPDKFLKKEDDFMKKVKAVLEANLIDDEFGISQLCTELAISHAQLYRKFKSLSNKTIADYFKSLRLNKARDMLLTTSLNIKEVSYVVGFKNISHFSREFSHEFGKSPREFRK